MCVRGLGNNMLSDPLEFFERTVRSVEESAGPVSDIQVDKLLMFSESEGDRLLSALTDFYPPGHWAAEQSNFDYIAERAMQLLSAGLCSLKNKEFQDGHPLECCARIVRAPTLSPYIRRSKFNYVVVPVGFLSSIEQFVSSTYAIATIGASEKDSTGKAAAWDEDLFLGSIAVFADAHLSTFTSAVMEASSESAMQQSVEGFSDPINFAVFDREFQKKMMEMMPSRNHWERFGYTNLGDALAQNPNIERLATKISRLAVCFAVCHEFGHVFTLSVDSEGAQELGKEETFTDMMGTLILYRLIENNILPVIINSKVTPRDLGHALAAFHSWNLSKELARLLKQKEDSKTKEALMRIHEVANRWTKAMTLIQKVWTEDVPVLASVGQKVSIGYMIVNHWGVMTSGMLRAALVNNGHNFDMEAACKVLPLLSNRESRIYTYLAG